MDILLKKKLYRKVTWALIFVGIYFLAIRPVRGVLDQVIYLPVIEHNLNFDQYVSSNTVSTKLIWENGKNAQLKFPFGIFFLMASLGLIIIEAKLKIIQALLPLHFLGGLIMYIALWFGIIYTNLLFVIIDLVSVYLIPFFSFMILLLAVGDKKRKNDRYLGID